MKNLFYLFAILVLASSCSAGKESLSPTVELKKEQLLAGKEDIRNAIESRRFILKFERLYYAHGGWIELRPRANFLVVDGKRASMSSAYLGSHMSSLPIMGINVEGYCDNFEIKKKNSGKAYEIRMTISEGNDSFDLYLTVGENGNCSTSVNALKISTIRYSGSLIPIDEVKIETSGKEAVI